MSSVLFADLVLAARGPGVFPWFYLQVSLSLSLSLSLSILCLYAYAPRYTPQKRLIAESVTGIGLSLLLALIVITLATGNWIISIMSTFVIFVIVVMVIGFTVMMGWKLGMIESIIFVMVVGMSVDYTVHISEAYLASGERTRRKRAKRMLGIVGGSVLSGALSTLLGIVWFRFPFDLLFWEGAQMKTKYPK